MPNTPRNRPKAIISHQKPRQAPPRRALVDGGHPPKRIIRLYRTPKLLLLPQRIKPKNDVAQGFPHPRYPYPAEKAAVRKAKHPISHQETTGVPLPIAETSADAKKDTSFGYAMINAAANLTQLSPKATTLPATTSVKTSASFTPLPPLPSLVATPSIDLQPVRPAPTTSVGSASGQVSQVKSQESPKLSAPLIVLLSVGLGFFALGLFFLIKFWMRPRRAGRIVPSLPIIEKAYTFDDESYSLDGKESPIFGGKERSASRLGAEGPLWTWVQYSKPVIKESNPTRDSGLAYNSDTPRETGTSGDKRVSASLLPTVPILPNPAALAARKRISTSSLYRDRESKDYGLAITGDGYPILERSRSKLARRSKSYSGLYERKRRDSAYHPDSAYGGADVSSPTTYFQPVTTPNLGATPGAGTEGRARIQSSYYAVAPYPRLSSLPIAYSIGTAQKVHLSKAYASERRRDDAHGEESFYAANSPDPTLYPEDSMSVMATSRQKRRSQSEHRRISRQLGGDLGTTKGLPEMDFGASRMSLSDLAEAPRKSNENRNSFQSNMATSESQKGLRSFDRPPRVPSPPPLPSLTQMALVHSHPEAYSTYRSPTYSIYGLYDSDRKSNAPNPA